MAVTLDERNAVLAQLDDGPHVERLHPALQVVVASAMALMAWALFIGVALYVFSGSAHAQTTQEQGAQMAAVADGASTAAVVMSGAAVEGNALLSGSPIGILAVTSVKFMAPRLTRGMEPVERKKALKAVTGIWSGAAANNLAILAGITGPGAVLVGVVAGLYFWQADRPDTAPINAPEPDAVLAMAQ